MMKMPLDFTPGKKFAYSNFGYCVLGRIIEKATGLSYEKFVQDQVLKPLGIESMRIGRTLDGQQAEGEARYYMPDNSKARSVFASRKSPVPWPHGGYCLEAMDAHGGWIGSAIDLARFAAANVTRLGRQHRPTAFCNVHFADAATALAAASGGDKDLVVG